MLRRWSCIRGARIYAIPLWHNSLCAAFCTFCCFTPYGLGKFSILCVYPPQGDLQFESVIMLPNIYPDYQRKKYKCLFISSYAFKKTTMNKHRHTNMIWLNPQSCARSSEEFREHSVFWCFQRLREEFMKKVSQKEGRLVLSSHSVGQLSFLSSLPTCVSCLCHPGLDDSTSFPRNHCLLPWFPSKVTD